MTNEQLKKLEDDLWDAANSLRAYGGIKASDYAVPVLGLIFLRFADNKYSHVEAEIMQEYEKHKGSRMERALEKIALEKCGFYLPENARYDYLLELPGEKRAQTIKEAMEAIESYQDAKFQGVLPKDAFFAIEKKKDDILPQLLKAFSDIPKDASGDIFGKIYEYFLGKFALSEGQKGGEFFTPTSVVRFIVEVIEPYSGKIYDPACGSGGMFVQSAKFVQEAKQDLNDIYVCGQDYMGETVRLAKMNLLVNNLRGEIVETNSYESDPHNSFGKFDYVMANPPFNVKTVKENTVKNDPRFTAYGLPTNKGKKDDKISDANYLWISLFASSMNEQGRAGFVMANSASDARNSEYEIRKNIVDSGIVDCMVTMPSNMFYTVTLPATIWFFDKGKVNTDRKDKILFLDGRNVYHQVDRAHREWTEEQVQNLTAIVRLYRGETHRYLQLIAHYIEQAQKVIDFLPVKLGAVEDHFYSTVYSLQEYKKESSKKRNAKEQKEFDASGLNEKIDSLIFDKEIVVPSPLDVFGFDTRELDNELQLQFSKDLKEEQTFWRETVGILKNEKETLVEVLKETEVFTTKKDKRWSDLGLNKAEKAIDEALQILIAAIDEVQYWADNIVWLQDRFPEAKYLDVTGLCKAASREECGEENDYSLNAGRYVGVLIEGENISQEEFIKMITSQKYSLDVLTRKSTEIYARISESLNELLA